jgi:antitoxin YefM
MRVVAYQSLHRNLAATLDSVTRNHEPVLIKRERGNPAAVLISLEDYTSFVETVHLLRSPRNAERLLASIHELSQ